MRTQYSRIAGLIGVAIAVALSVALAPGGSHTARAQGTPVAISIVDFAFNPPSVTVPVGGRVTWTNTGNATHTTTASGGAWDSGRLSPGQSFSFNATQAGTFNYACMIHPNMQATVIVQAAAGQAAAPAAGGQAAPGATLPRTGTGLVADSGNVAPVAVAAVLLLLGAAVVAHRRRRTA